MSIDFTALKQKVLKAAMECAAKGSGYSQQKPVLEAVASSFGGNMWTRLELDLQQAILTCWYDLFREGVLAHVSNLVVILFKTPEIWPLTTDLGT